MSVRTRIGLLVPSTNTTCEPDFYRVMPPDVTVHTHHLWLTNDDEGLDGMDHMNSEAERGARYLKTASVDAVVYGCTTGSFYKGAGYDDALVEIIRTASGVPAIATAPAVIQALRSVGAKSISVATPYPESINIQLKIYYESLGFEVLNVDGEPEAARGGHQEINDQSPASILDFAAQVCAPDADVLFCSCTAWRSFEVVEELERRVGRPVVTSNQATIWATLRQLGIARSGPAFGTLFAQPAD